MGESIQSLVNILLQNFNPLYCYILIGIIIGLESTGVPLPGEIVLISAVVFAVSTHNMNAAAIGTSAALGAIIGDNVGYLIGKIWGKSLFIRLGKKFPSHCGPQQIKKVEIFFQKHGVWTVFFGRFIALLRILSAPLAGSLKVTYWKFFIANAVGGIIWAGGTTWIIITVGKQAEKYIGKSSWILFIFFAGISFFIYAIWFYRNKRTDYTITDHNTSDYAVTEDGSRYHDDTNTIHANNNVDNV